MADPGPTNWKPVTGDLSEEAAGVFDRRFVYYRAKLPAKLPFAHTVVSCKTGVNGNFVGASEGSLASEKSVPQVETGAAVYIPTNPGTSFGVVYLNDGRPNGGAGMEAPGGITQMSLVDADALNRSIVDWRIDRLKDGDTGAGDTAAEVDVSKWRKFRPGNAEELKPLQSAVYRCTFDFTAKDAAVGRTLLAIGRIDDSGTIYVNGQKAGESNTWSEPVKLDLKPFLHPAPNTLAILVHNEQGSGGMGMGVSLDTAQSSACAAVSLHYEMGAQCTGDARQWYATDFDDSKWPATGDATHDATADALPHVNWSRFHFALPLPPAHAWVPLKLRLDAAGSGFIYLNGHPLGRWWAQGPQKDYFLPDCWLKRDGDNVVEVSLLGAEQDGVKSASVLPYDDLSEGRP